VGGKGYFYKSVVLFLVNSDMSVAVHSDFQKTIISVKLEISVILIPRSRASFGQHQESRPLAGSNFLRVRRVFLSYSQPIRFVRIDSEHEQSDGKSGNRGLPVLD